MSALRQILAFSGIVGFGYLLMKTTVPTEEELYNKLSPELKKEYHRVKKARLEKEQQMKMEEGTNSDTSQKAD
ncbi:hypothetical protein BB560_006351 [Smittium megazygosporum]|uniref:Uncharacterized protein n=1 Tax=Smittium megazygosporum TaxID=133381 RepID=A0A2T9Y8M7_9FUNG|nr:hypothetical protein BB560_006351 [Smittium megazygosporum]